MREQGITEKKIGVKATDLSKELQEVLYDYTNGFYRDLCDYSQYLVNGNDNNASPSLYTKSKAWWEKNILSFVTEDERKNAEKLLNIIENQPVSDEPLVRIERDRKDARPGEILSFGLRSASADLDFIEKIIDQEIEGFEDHDFFNGNWTEYRFLNSKNLDVSEISAYQDQKERIFAGRYKVVSTEAVAPVRPQWLSVETKMVDVAENVSEFTAKSGRPMIRYTYKGKERHDTVEVFQRKVIRSTKYQEGVFGRTIITLEVDEC